MLSPIWIVLFMLTAQANFAIGFLVACAAGIGPQSWHQAALGLSLPRRRQRRRVAAGR